MKKSLIALCLISSSASAAILEDVRILDGKPSAHGLELKLEAKNGPRDNYFTVDVVQGDPDAFNKLALVIQKLKKGEGLMLNLNIPSFSPSPPGSFYRSNDVKFSTRSR